MRHNIAGNRLSRNQTLRWATVRDLARAIIVEQRICTTKAKAKEARKLIEKLITMGKKGTLAEKRRAFAILCDHGLVSRLFNRTSPLFKNRIGGYTRIIPLGTRRGDNAELAFLELTEKEAVVAPTPKPASAKKAAKQESAPQAAGTPEKKPDFSEISKDQGKKNIVKDVKAPEKPKKLGALRKIFQRKTGAS